MRISVIEQDPGFIHDSLFWVVRLDGEPLTGCVTADEETGEAFVWVRESWLSDVPRVERLLGRVTIERDEGEDVRYAQGTVGFIDGDRFFTWADPSNPSYAKARALATHFWDHLEHRWFRTSDLRAH